MMQRYKTPALVIAAYLGTFLACIEISIVNVALPTLSVAFKADMAGMQWIVNIYAILLSAVMLSAGPLGDKYGHKRVWISSVVLFAIGSMICAFANELNTLLWGRGVLGIAGALLIPGAMPILTHAFTDKHKRALAIGGWSACNALALISGPLVGGLLIDHIGWPSIFWAKIPICIIAVLLGAWGISERKHPMHAAFDPFGQVLSIVWLGMLSYALIQIGGHGASTGKVFIPLSCAAVAFAVFILVEVSVKRPLFPIQLFRSISFAIANLASFALGVSAYASLFFLSLYFQWSKGETPSMTGLHLMPQFVVMGLSSVFFGRMVEYFSLKKLMVSGYVITGFSMCLMYLFSADTSYAFIIITLALLGLGMGLSVPATGMIVMEYAPAERAGIASATMNALRQIGMTLSIAVFGSLMSIYAIRDMAENVVTSSTQYAIEVATQAVIHNKFPSANDGLISIYQSAMASGFGMVMFYTGASSLLASILLFIFINDTKTTPYHVSEQPVEE